MLDVHPPEHAVHTWRDFVIHIATIVVGLLIAVGLEQTVESLHHRQQVRELREALTQERNENRLTFPANVACFRLQTAELKNNFRVLLYLRDHPGTPEEKLPGVLLWSTSRIPPAEAAWKSAQQTQVLSLMPREETERYQAFYRLQDETEQQVQIMFQRMARAEGFEAVDPDPSHMTADQLSTEIDLTQQALEATTTWGIYLMNVSATEPDFPSPLTAEEVFGSTGEIRSPEDRKKLMVASTITKQALAPWKAQLDAAAQAVAKNMK